MEEGNPAKQAPDRLELIRKFVNSVDFEDDEETFETPEALRAWFAERDLMGATEEVTEGDLRRAIDVREGLRALLLANNGAELDREAVARLDRAASRAGLRVHAGPGSEPCLEPDARGVDGALAALLGIVATSVADGTWTRFKACPRDVCRWAFYDRSKNRSGRWCEMEVCGNVEKARAYRQRRKGGRGRARARA
jgi:predicted RNA-binding Zn ribbon-like protein